VRLRVSLSDEVADLAAVGDSGSLIPRQRNPHPQGFEPGVRWDGHSGELNTGPLTAVPTCWDDLLRMWDLDPEQVEVVEPVERRSWDAAVGGGVTQRMNYYKAKVRRRSTAPGADVEALCKQISKHRPNKTRPTGNRALMVCLADWQIGKPDGDGTTGTVNRVLAMIDAVTNHTRELRKQGVTLGALYVVGLGDLIENCAEHYAQQTFRAELNLTEQVRVVRRLLVKALTTWAPLFEQVIVPCVPGNHGENRRGGKSFTDFTDNHDTAVFEQAAAVLEANPQAYGHVSFLFPTGQDLTVTLDVKGTTVALAHGHQMRGGAHKWWAEQSHGMRSVGDATLLLSGHYHHLRLEQPGARTWIQAPALDGGSDWWTNQTGQLSAPGTLTLVVGGGGWDHLRVL
jgi:predicted phosphodiesterase